MIPRPLPIRTLMFTMLALASLSMITQFFGYRQLHGYGLIAASAAIAANLGYHAWRDNLRVSYQNVRSVRILFFALIAWVPFFFLLLPGIVFTLYCNDRIDAALRYAEQAAAGKIERIDVEIEEIVSVSEKTEWSWWWPPDWLSEGTRIVQRKVMRTVQEDVLRPAPIWLRSVFALVYAIMRVMQLVLYSTLTFIGIRSFIFLLARSALWNQAKIEFTIP